MTPTPFTPGLDGMGTVAAIGAGVTKVRAGDRVSVNPDGGSYAEVVIAREELVNPVDASISDEAAASATTLVTAWNILHMVARVQPGESVLVHAAAGGVGSLLVQMAREAGAGKIFATAGSPAKLETRAQLRRRRRDRLHERRLRADRARGNGRQRRRRDRRRDRR